VDGVREELSLRNFRMMFIYLFTAKLAASQLVSKIRRMDFPIASSAEAQKIYEELKGQNVEDVLISAKIARMKIIERIDSNFWRSEYIAQILPGETFEQVSIVKGKRRLASIATYTIAADVKLGWDGQSSTGKKRYIERILSQSDSFNVTPSPVTLSMFAIVFSFLGAALLKVEKLKETVSSDIKPHELMELFNANFALSSFMAAVLAVVLYNSIEMTEFKSRVGSISWRSAMFIGLLCGLLSEKMLKAITTFAGG
jgi:hypothetical protein